jgi:hypothetical protein
MKGSEGPVNVFEGTDMGFAQGEDGKPVDDHLKPFCKNQDTPRADVDQMMLQHSNDASQLSMKIPDMREGCQRFDQSPCDVTDFNGCWYIQGALVNNKSFTMCGPYGASLPKADVLAAMAAIVERCTLDDKVGGVVSLSGDISIRLSPLP